MATEPNGDVFPWLKSLPVAPEYWPIVAEFQDPIAYIFKIKKEASMHGICKIILITFEGFFRFAFAAGNGDSVLFCSVLFWWF